MSDLETRVVDRKVSEGMEHEDAPTTAAAEPRARAAFGRHVGGRCHDQRRLCSPTITRAFAAVTRRSALGSQSEVSSPAELILAPT